MGILVIAEVGSVHDGSFGNAKRLVDLAADLGADVVKFQTHIAQAETTRAAPAPPYFSEEARYAYFERTAFRADQWHALKRHCDERGTGFLSSPFSLEAVDLLETVGVSAYKIPSGEVTNLPLVRAVAETGKPVFLSSGMSTWAELDAAVDMVLRHHRHLTVLQCSSAYPCPYEQVGLNVLAELKGRYQLPIGLSDHTSTNYAAFAAAALGATVVEKHLTFSRYMYGSDAKHSAEPAQFRDLVEGLRAIEVMTACPVDKDDASPYQTMKLTFEKSIVALVDIPAGCRIGQEMIGLRKPGGGLPPARLRDVIGSVAARSVAGGSLLQAEDVVWDVPASS